MAAAAICTVISAVSVRALETLFGPDVVEAAALTFWQAKIFHSVDIVLTAGLIAGGSTGINSVADLLGTFVEASRKRATAR